MFLDRNHYLPTLRPSAIKSARKKLNKGFQRHFVLRDIVQDPNRKLTAIKIKL